MVISVSETFVHNSPCSQKLDRQQEEIKNLVMQLIEKNGLNPDQVKWNNGSLELQKSNNLKLHSLMLQMEELGLDLKMTKQTLIEIC